MISKRIKQVRKLLKMSQQDFGNKLGVSRDVIGNIEYGRVEPKEPFLDLLCRVFNINHDWLFTGSGEPIDANIEVTKNIDEAIRTISSLSPELQDYALEQMRGLLKVQQGMMQGAGADVTSPPVDCKDKELMVALADSGDMTDDEAKLLRRRWEQAKEKQYD